MAWSNEFVAWKECKSQSFRFKNLINCIWTPKEGWASENSWSDAIFSFPSNFYQIVAHLKPSLQISIEYYSEFLIHELPHLDVIEILLEKGFKIDSRDSHDNTPLHIAVERFL